MGEPGGFGIERRIVNGGGPQFIVFNVVPRGLGLHQRSGKLYWINTDVSRIQRANYDGSEVEDVLAIAEFGFGLAIDEDAGSIYWSEQSTDSIRRASLDGSNVQNVVTGLDGLLTDVAIDSVDDKLYWLGNGVVERSNLDGSGREVLVNVGTGGLAAIALDLVNDKVYWTNNGGLPRRISRANLDGSGLEDEFIVSASNPQGVAIDPHGGIVFWTERSAGGGTLHRANLDGTSLQLLINLDDAGSIVLEFCGDGIVDPADRCDDGSNDQSGCLSCGIP